jgi:hypothetical protein
MIYTTLIMTTQANRSMGWPPPIPLNCVQNIIGLMVNIGIRGSVAKPYQSTLKYPNYKKDANLDAHVKVFQAAIKANGETSEKYIINVFSYTLKKTTSNWCHNHMSKFLECFF